MGSKARLVGGRLALVGALLYVSEWLVIPFSVDLPTDDLGDDASVIAAAYAGHGTELAFLAGWLSFALLGRIVFVAALRSAFRDSPRETTLVDIAVAAMAVSVAIEIVQLGLVATAGWLAEANADAGAIVALDGAGTVLFGLVLAPIGASVLASSMAMLLSGLFARWRAILGVVAGALVVAGGVVSTTGAGDTGTVHDLADPLTGPPVALFWSGCSPPRSSSSVAHLRRARLEPRSTSARARVQPTRARARERPPSAVRPRAGAGRQARRSLGRSAARGPLRLAPRARTRSRCRRSRVTLRLHRIRDDDASEAEPLAKETVDDRGRLRGNASGIERRIAGVSGRRPRSAGRRPGADSSSACAAGRAR